MSMNSLPPQNNLPPPVPARPNKASSVTAQNKSQTSSASKVGQLPTGQKVSPTNNKNFKQVTTLVRKTLTPPPTLSQIRQQKQKLAQNPNNSSQRKTETIAKKKFPSRAPPKANPTQASKSLNQTQPKTRHVPPNKPLPPTPQKTTPKTTTNRRAVPPKPNKTSGQKNAPANLDRSANKDTVGGIKLEAAPQNKAASQIMSLAKEIETLVKNENKLDILADENDPLTNNQEKEAKKAVSKLEAKINELEKQLDKSEIFSSNPEKLAESDAEVQKAIVAAKKSINAVKRPGIMNTLPKVDAFKELNKKIEQLDKKIPDLTHAITVSESSKNLKLISKISKKSEKIYSSMYSIRTHLNRKNNIGTGKNGKTEYVKKSYLKYFKKRSKSAKKVHSETIPDFEKEIDACEKLEDKCKLIGSYKNTGITKGNGEFSNKLLDDSEIYIKIVKNNIVNKEKFKGNKSHMEKMINSLQKKINTIRNHIKNQNKAGNEADPITAQAKGDIDFTGFQNDMIGFTAMCNLLGY